MDDKRWVDTINLRKQISAFEVCEAEQVCIDPDSLQDVYQRLQQAVKHWVGLRRKELADLASNLKPELTDTQLVGFRAHERSLGDQLSDIEHNASEKADKLRFAKLDRLANLYERHFMEVETEYSALFKGMDALAETTYCFQQAERIAEALERERPDLRIAWRIEPNKPAVVLVIDNEVVVKCMPTCMRAIYSRQQSEIITYRKTSLLLYSISYYLPKQEPETA